LSRFRRYLYYATALSNVPFAVGLAWLLGGGATAWTAAVLVAAVLTMGLRGRLALAFDDRPISPLRRWLVEKPWYTHWCAGLGSLPMAALLSPMLWVPSLETGHVAASAYLAALGLAGWGVFVRAHRVRIRTVDVFVDRLPEPLEGYRIAHLSDLHVGAMIPPERARRWVDRTNQIGADLVALTGDYVTSGTRFHEAVARELGRLRAKDGTVAVLGNHDNFGGCEPLASTLRDVGVTLLMNGHHEVERGGATLAVVGVDDVFSRRADVDASFEGVPEEAVVVGLAHDPRLFPAMAKRGARLVLSGHTHWGQVGVPLLHRHVNLARPFFRFPGGMYEKDGASLWVHPGIGTTGPPVRFGVAPEITVVVLRRRIAAPA
jgi:hypothetical protein